MPVRILDQNPQYLNITGDELLVGGTITSYLSGTSTLQATKTDSTLSTNNSNPLQIDSQGRVPDMWTGVPLTLVLADASGAIIWTRDDVESPLEIPTQAGQQGKFLSTNGTALEWDSVSQVPDVTGQTGKILSNDGTDAFWAALSTLNIPVVTSNTNGTVIGNVRIQWGTGSAPTTGFRQVVASVIFPTGFSAPPYFVGVMPTSTSVTTGLQLPVPAVTGKSTGGFNVQFDSDDFGQTNAVFVQPVPFDWFAIGPV